MLTSLAHGECTTISHSRTGSHEAANKKIGPREAVQGLLSSGALAALLSAITELQQDDPQSLKLALIRSLRAVTVAIAENVGIPLWGLVDDIPTFISDAQSTLNYIFKVRFSHY